MFKKKIFLIFSVFILVACYIIVFSFYLKDKNSSKKTTIPKNEVKDIVTVDKVLNFIDEFSINKLDGFNIFFDSYNDLNNQLKLEYSYYAIKDDVNFSLGVSYTKLDSYLNNVFGKNITIKNEDVYYQNSKDLLLKYDNINEVYIEKDSNIKKLYCSNYNYVIDFKTKNDSYILLVNKFFEKNNKVYSSLDDLTNDTNILFEIPKNVSDNSLFIKDYVNTYYQNLINNLITYKYIFSKENSSLILKSFIKVK